MTNLLKLGKKIFTVGVVSTTIFWSLGVAALVPAVASAATVVDCGALNPGDMIKTAAGSDIWVLNSDKSISYFSDGDLYKSWTADKKYSFNLVDKACATSFSPAGAVYPRPGTYLVKAGLTDTLYAVLPGMRLQEISADAAKALYGAKYNLSVPKGGRTVTIDNASWLNFSKTIVAGVITEATPTEGTLVKNAGKYYVVGASMTLKEVTATGLTANKFQTGLALALADTTAYTMGTSVDAQDAMLSDITQGAKGTGVAAPGVPTATVSGSVTVALAASTPVSGTVVAGQAIADLAHFTFTGNGTVTSLKVKRIGVSADTTLNNVYLYDGNTKLTDAGSVSNGIVTFSNGAGLFTVSGTKTISVKSDILSSNNGNSTSGQTVGVAINAASDIGGTTAAGTFPVTGNTFSVASADLATVNFATTTATSPGGSITAGTTNATLWSASASVGTRAVSLQYLALREIGSVPNDAFANLNLYVAGVKVAAGVMSPSNILTFDLSSAPVSLNTGSRLLEVRGDVVKGSSRTFSFTLQNVSDLVVSDSSYGVNVSATAPANATSFSSVATVSNTVSAGTVTVTTDPSFSTTQVVKNSSGVTLGKWLFKAYGEDEKIMTLNVDLVKTGSATTTEKLNNLAIFVNGGQVGSSKTHDLTGSATEQYGSGNLFTIPAGQTVTVEVRGDLQLVDATALTGISATVTLPANQAQGGVSFTTTPSVDNVQTAASTLSIVAGTVTLNYNPSFNSNQSIAQNGQKVRIGSFVLQASNADTVRVTNINVGLTGGLGITNLANLYISDNTNAMSPQLSNNFAVDFTLQPNDIKIIDVFADVGNAAGSLQTTLGVTAQNGSGSDASKPNQSGQALTVGTGTLIYPSTQTNGSLTSQYVLGGTDQTALSVYNFVASTSPVVLDEMGFTFSGSSVTAGDEPITSVTINNKTFYVVGHAVTTTGLGLTIPVGFGGLDVPVSVHFNTAGIGGIHAGNAVTSTLTYVKYKSGAQSLSTSTLSVASNPVTVMVSKPSFGVVASSDKLVNGLVKVGSIYVSADSHGDILLNNVPVTVNGTTATLATSSLASSTLAVKDTNGNDITGVTDTSFNAGASVTDHVLNFNGYKIGANTNKTFDIYMTAANVSGAVNTCSLTFKLGSKGLLTWTDVAGNTSGAGTLLYGYPNTSVSINN